MNWQMIIALGLLLVAIPFVWRQIARNWRTGETDQHCENCPANPMEETDSSQGRL